MARLKREGLGVVVSVMASQCRGRAFKSLATMPEIDFEMSDIQRVTLPLYSYSKLCYDEHTDLHCLRIMGRRGRGLATQGHTQRLRKLRSKRHHASPEGGAIRGPHLYLNAHISKKSIYTHTYTHTHYYTSRGTHIHIHNHRQRHTHARAHIGYTNIDLFGAAVGRLIILLIQSA